MVGVGQDLIEDRLGEQRREQCQDFQQQSEDQDLTQSGLEAADAPGQGAPGEGIDVPGLAEIRSRAEFQGDAGELAADLVQRQRALALGGVVNDDLARTHAAQDDEVVEPPVQDAGALELIEFLDLQTQGPALQAQGLRHLDQAGQRGAL